MFYRSKIPNPNPNPNPKSLYFAIVRSKKYIVSYVHVVFSFAILLKVRSILCWPMYRYKTKNTYCSYMATYERCNMFI